MPVVDPRSDTPPAARTVLLAAGPVADADEALAFTVALQQSGVVVDVRRYEVTGGRLIMLLVPTSRAALERTVRALADGKTVAIDGRPVTGPSAVDAAEEDGPGVEPVPFPLKVDWAALLVLARPHALLAAAALAVAAVFLLQPFRDAGPALSSVPSDDAWSRFVYARNLADHGRLSFDGEGWDAGFASLSWTLALTAAAGLTFGGLGPVALGKGLSLLAALALPPLAYGLGAALGGRRWVGALAGLLVALDPLLAFESVGGTEAPLLAALLAGALLAALRGRLAASGLLLGAAVLTRPEGLLFAALLGVGLVIPRVAWFGLSPRRGEVRALLVLAVPPALAAALWGLYGLLADGTALPVLWRAGGDGVGLLSSSQWDALWDGVLADAPYARWWAVAPFTLLVAAGAAGALRRGGGAAPAALAFPPALVALYAAVGPGPGGWSRATAHLLAPAVPFLLVLAAVGVPVLWRALASGRPFPGAGRIRAETRHGLALGAMLAVLVLAPSAVPAALADAVDTYARRTQAVRDLGVEPAAALVGTAPGEGPVATRFPGATAYEAGWREVIDLRGRDAEAVILARRPAAAVVPPAETWRNHPAAFHVRSFGAEAAPDGLPSELALYRFDWARPLDDPAIPWGAEPDGLELLDRLDIGDFAAEAMHHYSVDGPASVVDVTARVADGRAVTDRGRWLEEGTSQVFVVPVGSRTDLTLLTRYDTRYPGRLRAFVDGNRVADWSLPGGELWLGTARFGIPPLYLLEPKPFIEIRLEVVDAPEGGVRLFHHWLYQRP